MSISRCIRSWAEPYPALWDLGRPLLLAWAMPGYWVSHHAAVSARAALDVGESSLPVSNAAALRLPPGLFLAPGAGGGGGVVQLPQSPRPLPLTLAHGTPPTPAVTTGSLLLVTSVPQAPGLSEALACALAPPLWDPAQANPAPDSFSLHLLSTPAPSPQA